MVNPLFEPRWSAVKVSGSSGRAIAYVGGQNPLMSQVIYHLRKVFEKKGDALNMPSPDAAFDVVLSKFGVMFAPNQEKAASELIHVCRPGGAIGLANCMSGGLFGEMSRIIAKYASSAPGLIPAALWGT